MNATQPHETRPDTCQWRLAAGWEGDTYDMGCDGGVYSFIEESIEDNIKGGMNYCPFCGGRIVWTEADWQVREREERAAEEASDPSVLGGGGNP